MFITGRYHIGWQSNLSQLFVLLQLPSLPPPLLTRSLYLLLPLTQARWFSQLSGSTQVTTSLYSHGLSASIRCQSASSGEILSTVRKHLISLIWPCCHFTDRWRALPCKCIPCKVCNISERTAWGSHCWSDRPTGGWRRLGLGPTVSSASSRSQPWGGQSKNVSSGRDFSATFPEFSAEGASWGNLVQTW